MKTTTVLALESSCDETAVAILRQRGDEAPEILSSLISSQISIHREFGGVVPEVASRNHTTTIAPLVEQSLSDSGLAITEIDAFAATAGPGLAAALLVGNTFAKGLAAAAQKPFLAINHMEGHLLSPFIGQHGEIPPHLGLIVSGGHTMLVDVGSHGDYKLVGQTRDDAAGEAFDKVGKMLGLPYPGGPEIEKHARDGDPKSYDFPRSMLRDPHFDFSFSGLKTAVLYTLQKLDEPQAHIADLCASFQSAVIESLVRKAQRAAAFTGRKMITLSGGVSCNQALVTALSEASAAEGIAFLPCPRQHSTDNATMIAFAALHAYHAGARTPLDSEIHPSLALVPAAL